MVSWGAILNDFPSPCCPAGTSVRIGMRCIPIIAAGNKTGRVLSALRHPLVPDGETQPVCRARYAARINQAYLLLA